MADIFLPTLKTTTANIAPNVMVVGDPARAASAAELLSDRRQVASFREFSTYTGSYQGQPVTVISHGVGASGASMCFHEIFQARVRNIIRAGTCGAMHEQIQDGELLIATGAVREDGTSAYLIPPEYPAFADRFVVGALDEAAKANQTNAYTGVILTRANFYPGLLPEPYPLWMKAGVLGVEMELAVLLVMASLNGARGGGIFVSDGNLARDVKAEKAPTDVATYNPHREVVAQGVQTMLHVTLEALSHLAQQG